MWLSWEMVIITTFEILHGWCGICLPDWTSCGRIEFTRWRWCHNSPSCKCIRVQIEVDWMKYNYIYIVVCHISLPSYKHLLKPNCSLLLYNSSTCEACLSPTPKCGKDFLQDRLWREFHPQECWLITPLIGLDVCLHICSAHGSPW